MRVLLSLVLLSASAALAQPSPTPSNAPRDNPVAAAGDKKDALDAAIAPYVARAKETYPDARKRYLAGLPAKHIFYLVTRLKDDRGNQEQVFVEIRRISDGRAAGIIASDLHAVRGFKKGGPHTFPEDELLDWLISKPDGTEEGNFVGRFLDSLQRKSR